MLSQNHQAFFRAFGLYLAQLRKLRGFTQAELAGAIGVSQRSIIAYERSERRVTILTIWRLARFFEMSMDDLVGMINDVPVRNRRLPPPLVRQVKLMQLPAKNEPAPSNTPHRLDADTLAQSRCEVPTPGGRFLASSNPII